MFQIRSEVPADHGTIDALLDAGFGADRRHRTVYRLRQSAPAAGLSFVAADPVSDEPLATLRFWEVRIGGTVPAMLLGPLAVRRDLQGQGLGRALVAHGVPEALAKQPLCLVSGEPDYYRPFGFVSASLYGITMPGPVHAGWLQVRAAEPAAIYDLLTEAGPAPRVIGPTQPLVEANATTTAAEAAGRGHRPASVTVLGQPAPAGLAAR